MICTGLILCWRHMHNPFDNPLWSPCDPLDNPPLPGRSLPCSWIPLTYLESLLCVWCDSRPLWSRLLVYWPPPLPLLFPFSFLLPNGSPNSLKCPSTPTSWHRLHIVLYNKYFLQDSVYLLNTVFACTENIILKASMILDKVPVSKALSTLFESKYLKDMSNVFFHF